MLVLGDQIAAAKYVLQCLQHEECDRPSTDIQQKAQRVIYNASRLKSGNAADLGKARIHSIQWTCKFKHCTSGGDFTRWPSSMHGTFGAESGLLCMGMTV